MITSIVILTYNQLDYTKQCIESIRTYTKQGSYELIVVDNASTDSTREWISEQQDIKAIFNEKNMGFPKGCNQGIEISTGDQILLLNNDVVVTHNWLENMLVALHSDESVGAVGCLTNRCSYKQTVPVEYESIEEMHSFAETFNILNPSKWEQRLKLVGFCFLTKREVVENIGMLEELFSPGNYEDDDYSLRIRLAGYKLILCRDTFIHHYGSVSFNSENQNLKYLQLLRKNEQKFKGKWGFDPNYSQHVRNEIVALIDESVDKPLHILEVGCACGGTLLEIQNKYKNSKLYGIELNSNSAKIASLIAEMQEANVESDVLTYPQKFFDYIIFADVLEHMSDPWAALTNLRKHLKPDGKILISLPNIMHYSVMSKLLTGNWAYEDAGILDRTHLRFFSLTEIKKMVMTTGYVIDKLGGTTLPSNFKDTESFIEQLSAISLPEVREQFNVYQYTLQLSKNGLFDIISSLFENRSEPKEIIEQLKDYSYQNIIEVVLNIPDVSSKVELLNTIGVAHFEMGSYDKVLPYFENAYNLDLANTEVLYNLSYFLEFIGESEEAKVFKTELEKIDPESYSDLIHALTN